MSDSMTSDNSNAAYMLKYIGILFLVLLLLGCGTQQVTVEGKYPTPLITPIPLKLGLYLKPEFQQHQYHYQPKQSRDSELIIDSGFSQTQMINTITAAMFKAVTKLDAFPSKDNTANVDAVLVPTIEEFQHAIPNHTKINVFEIWVRYRFQLFSPDGETIADWYMSAYGKTPSQFMDSAEDSINLAAVVAFRDAGANFSLNFDRIPEVKLWLDDTIDDGATR